MALVLQPITLLFLYSSSLILFFLPGAAVSFACAARLKLSTEHALVVMVVSTGTFGYLAFWIYLASKVAGQIFSYSLALASLAIVFSFIRTPRVKILVRELATPAGYVFVTGFCYLSLFYIFSNPFNSGADVANLRFFNGVQPGDNLIPLFFAEKIYAHQPLSPICCGDWLSSDRPPLQAGIFLLQRPLRLLGSVGLQYQILGTVLQCLWICGVWMLLRVLRASAQSIKQALGFLVFSGFLFYNSVYVWPKLLAAAFMLFVAAFFLDARINSRALTGLEIALAALSFSLAILAHPGSVFTLPALFTLLLPRIKPYYASAMLILLLFAAPWMAYQKFYDPPGNRLLKMHLAGVVPVDSRSTWQAFRDSYGSHSLGTIARNKWGNLTGLLGPPSRIAQREYMFNAIGVVDAAWLVVPFFLMRKDARRALPRAGLLILIALLNILIWALVMFGPAQTFTTVSSYADILILCIGLLGFLLLLPPFVVATLFALEVLNFFAWVFFKPLALPRPDNIAVAPTLQWPILIAGLLCTAALLWHFGRSYFQAVCHTRV